MNYTINYTMKLLMIISNGKIRVKLKKNAKNTKKVQFEKLFEIKVRESLFGKR